MGWTYVAKHGGMGMEEQWLFRPSTAPLCALKRGAEGWEASLLNTSGISTAILHMGEATLLTEAMTTCENELERMGWKWNEGKDNR